MYTNFLGLTLSEVFIDEFIQCNMYFKSIFLENVSNLQNVPSTVLIKQDPVMVAHHKDEPPDPDTDFILQDTLPLFDNR